MRRWFVIHLFGLSIALTLTGCDVVQQLWPWLIEQNPPDTDTPDEPPAAPSIEHASTFMALNDGRVLSATREGFRIIDVRDARHPRVEGLVDLACDRLSFYRADQHVILLAEFAWGYAGDRNDVPLRKRADSLLVNVDISDRAHPTIVDEIALDDLPRSSLMRKAPESTAIFVFPMIYDQIYRSRVERYDLRDGVLRKTAELLLDSTAEPVSATPEKLLVATQSAPGQGNVTVIDIAAGGLTASYKAAVPGPVARFYTELALDDNRLRVAYGASGTGLFTIDTFDLGAPPSAAAVGRCVTKVRSGETSGFAFAEPADDLFVSKNDPNGQLIQYVLDAAGNCPNHVSYGPYSRSSQLRAFGPERMLGYGPNGLSMYETAATASARPIARAPLPAPFTEGSASGPIQLLAASPEVAAVDGTPEPQLAGIPINGWPAANGFQLLTLSDHTITPRGGLDLRARPDALAFLASGLVAASATELRTYDARDLNAPIALGQLELAEQYLELFSFGEYIVRIRVDPYIGPPDDRARLVHDELQVLPRRDAGSGVRPIAALPVESTGQWLQVGDALVNAQLRGGVPDEFGEPASEITLQAYDLSDPVHPRKAGSLATTEIEAQWTGGHFPEGQVTYHRAGRALVVQHGKRLPNVTVRQCTRNIDYNVCEHEATPTCTRETYSGERTCRAIDGGPETCLVNILHCKENTCELLSALPPGIPLGPQGCYEFPERNPTRAYAFDIVDLRDPDRPLVVPEVALPDDSVGHDFFVSTDRIYATEETADGIAARVIDLRDPAAPTINPPRPVAESIVAVDDDVVYSAARWRYPPAPLRLSRTRCCGEDSQLLAARDWPDRTFISLVHDGAGKLYLMHGPLAAADPKSNWDRLEILDEETLGTLSVLDIDTSANAQLPPVDGKLLVGNYTVLYLIDVRDPRRPSIQAALPSTGGSELLDGNGVLVSDGRGLRAYPLDLRNMP